MLAAHHHEAAVCMLQYRSQLSCTELDGCPKLNPSDQPETKRCTEKTDKYLGQNLNEVCLFID